MPWHRLPAGGRGRTGKMPVLRGRRAHPPPTCWEQFTPGSGSTTSCALPRYAGAAFALPKRERERVCVALSGALGRPSRRGPGWPWIAPCPLPTVCIRRPHCVLRHDLLATVESVKTNCGASPGAGLPADVRQFILVWEPFSGRCVHLANGDRWHPRGV